MFYVHCRFDIINHTSLVETVETDCNRQPTGDRSLKIIHAINLMSISET